MGIRHVRHLTGKLRNDELSLMLLAEKWYPKSK